MTPTTPSLDALRDQARRHAEAARAIDAERSDTTLTIDGDRYFIRVERRHQQARATKAKPNPERVLVSERIQIRERTHQGEVIFAAPLEWL